MFHFFFKFCKFFCPNPQSTFTCSKLTKETLEQGVEYVQDNNKETETTPLASLLLTLNIFHILF